MKKLAIVAVCLMATVGAYAQGSFAFGNRVTSAGIDAPVLDGAGARLDGTAYLAQLFVNGNPVGTPLAFRTGAAAGYISTTSVDAGVPYGTTVDVQMRAWRVAAGADYAAASASMDASRLGNAGASATLSLAASGVNALGLPDPPANLTGLQGFSLVVVPEPSTIALGLLGAALLFLRRRK
jgi:hypothetical protein